MPAKNLNRVDSEGSYSYVFNKGVSGTLIFADKKDCETFVNFLKGYLSEQDRTNIAKKEFTVKGKTFTGTPHQPKNYYGQIELTCYSLTPTSFHLVLKQLSQGSVEKLLRSLCTRYSMYYNKRHSRSGPLFQGPYKSTIVPDLDTLLTLSAYIHTRATDKNYSSLPEFTSERSSGWVLCAPVLAQLSDGSNYADFVNSQNLKGNYEEKLGGYILDEPEDLPPALPTLSKSQNEYLEEAENYNNKHSYRFAEYSLLALSFVVLSYLGIVNINAQNPLQISEIADAVVETVDPVEETTQVAVATPELETEEIEQLSIIDKKSLMPEVAEPEGVLGASTNSVLVMTETANEAVSIHERPTVDSKEIGKAHSGDMFVLLGTWPGWYEIKLPDDTKGFVMIKYLYVVQNSN